MKLVSIHDAKTNLSKYIADAKNGEDIYIGSYAKPEVVLMAVKKSLNTQNRNFDLIKNKLKAEPDAFSTETEELISKMMGAD
jgi:prevent-host-death family protein